MKKCPLIIVYLLLFLSPFFSDAQINIEFTSFEVDNVNNQHYVYECLLGCMVTSTPEDAYSEITATIHNTSDTTVTLIFSNDDARLGHVYYSKQKHDWVCFDDFKDTLQIQPYGSLEVSIKDRYIKYFFTSTSSLYYFSDMAANMRLYMVIPGHGTILSGTAQRVIVNGVELNSECKGCGYTYTLVNNELMNEYIQEQPWLFRSGISDELIRQEFACNLSYARRLYSLMNQPIIK